MGFDGGPFVPIICTLVETQVEQGQEGWRLATWGSLVLVLIFLGYGSRLADGDPPPDALYRYDSAIGGIVIYGVFFLILVWIARGLPVMAESPGARFSFVRCDLLGRRPDHLGARRRGRAGTHA